jgi:hypothetical protein
MRSIAFAVAVLAVLMVGYDRWRARSIETEEANAPPAFVLGESLRTHQQFVCEGKTRCSQMHSCEEATFYLNHCPNVAIDGDNDGVPCEDQLCGH